MTTPPRSEDLNSTEATSSMGTLVTWCTWRGTAGPPPVLGRTAEDADQRLLEHLAHYFTYEAEDPCEHPRIRARQEHARYKNRGLLCHCAPDEAAGFVMWVEISSLSADEALTRWRAAFPCAGEVDPLADIAVALEQERQDAERRPPRPVLERIHVLGRFLDKLPRMSGSGVESLRTAFEAPTT